MEEKDNLLDEYKKEITQENNLSFSFLIRVYIVMFIGFAILIPNIYIKNQIYYISRDIDKLYNENIILQEEETSLKEKIESIKFENQVLDTEFMKLSKSKPK